MKTQLEPHLESDGEIRQSIWHLTNSQLEGKPAWWKKYYGYIDGKPELFGTKLLKIQTGARVSAKSRTILLISRDAGSGNALLPVIKSLIKQKHLLIFILTDGLAQEIFQSNLATEDISPKGDILEYKKLIPKPDVVLVDRSSSIDLDILYSLFSAPMVLVEDYYGSDGEFIKNILRYDKRLPEKICVMDEAAKSILLMQFPNLESRVVVTGQPAFDQYFHEKTAKITTGVKQKLGLGNRDKIVVFMSTPDITLDQIEIIAKELEKSNQQYKLIFRKHPKDNTEYAKYDEVFRKYGITLINAEHFSSNQIGATADLIITSWSTEGLKAIYRRKNSIHLLDEKHFDVPKGISAETWPPVTLGASVGVEDIKTLHRAVDQLLDATSPESKGLRQSMEAHYPSDGKNTQRVIATIESIFSR